MYITFTVNQYFRLINTLFTVYYYYYHYRCLFYLMLSILIDIAKCERKYIQPKSIVIFENIFEIGVSVLEEKYLVRLLQI